MSATISPKVAALLERGMQLMQQENFLEAARAFERAAQQVPTLGDAHAMRADALMRAGKLDAALASAERALRLRPRWGEALMLRGSIEALLERFPAAEASFRAAMDLLGPSPALQANLGNVFLEQERFAEALQAFDQALAARDAPQLHASRAGALYALGMLAEAEQAWNAVLERQPDSLEAMEQLLQIYMRARRIDELEAICRRAAALSPGGAVFRIGLGFATWWRGRHDEALELYREAARLAAGSDPGLHYEANLNEAMCLLKLGRWKEGWARYRWRIDREALRERYARLAPEPSAIASATSPLCIRIHMEQGLGDELFFLRFAPFLRRRGHRLSYRTHVKLIPLLEGATDLFEGIGCEDEPDPLACDVELQSSDLALASGESFAAPFPLAVDAQRRERAAARLRDFGPPPYVGVTWRAGLVPEERKQWRGVAVWSKHAPVERLGEILGSLSASVVILQRKPDAEEQAAFLRSLGRHALDAQDVNDDLRDALAMLSLLDDYIGVSNTNMHLLASVPGRSARVLVQTPAEWRWAMSGAQSPWFPGFRLYRQERDGSWETALAALQDDLQKEPA